MRPGPERDWEWRRRVRSNAHSHRIYRWAVGVAGLLIVLVGLALVPLPGPGWLIVVCGVVVWASEFEWAERLRDWLVERLRGWTAWLTPQAWYVKATVGLLTTALVLGVFYGLFLVSGVPAMVPDPVEQWVKRLPGL
ncbi:MAG TPA: TIGR02611 family protein [Pedococcus sp.]|nr:TIGR02611 family protein [Pedococcus sp.]